ncbi:sugar ABC transporter substrate-binding protein [Nocardioides sp. Iso805N]|uniref:sugar ABC transporter substrate-binding protein n=1 Tax=Nocardioides sp. Iso805N TaxID=1283287 RepID=UPI00037EE8CE|nr:substrate-binding domain-containing protein [Nocardioides sp. Iso805N]
MSKPVQRARRARLLGTAAVVSVAAIALAACGSGSSDSATGGGGAGVSDSAIQQAKDTIAQLEKPITNWPAVAPVTKPVDFTGKTVMVIPLGDTIPVMHGMALGAKQALEHQGATVTMCDGKINPTQVASCLQQAASQKDFAVISMFVAYPMDGTGFDAAAKAGVKVLIAGDTPEKGKTYPAGIDFFSFGTSLQTLSQHEADAAIAEKGKDTNVIWLGQTDSADTIAQADAGEKRFKEVCPSCGFQLARYSTANSDKVPSTLSSLLVRNPKTNVVVLPVDTLAPQALQGIQSAGYAQKVTIISTGGDLSGLQRIASGTGQSHDFAAPVLYNGYAMVNGLMQLAGGQKVDPLVNVTRDISKNNVKNIKLSEDEYFTNHWFGDDSFEQAFYTAWGSK